MARQPTLPEGSGRCGECHIVIADEQLAADPVFQLNVLLWALNDLPDSGLIHPVLRQAGYSLDSIGRQLLVPANAKTLDAILLITGSRDGSPSRPDLWIDNVSHDVMLVVELKSRGFSRNSSNIRQASKLIVGAHDLADSLSEPEFRAGHVVYGTVMSDAAKLAATLRLLRENLEANQVRTAPTATIGISINRFGVSLCSPDLSELPAPAANVLQEPALVLERTGSDDLRPLYLIPWIPGIAESQHPKLQADGFRELTARVIVAALAQAGQANVSTTLKISGEKLLNVATFGVFAHWHDADRRDFVRAAIKVAGDALVGYEHLDRSRHDSISIGLPDSEAQQEVIRLLEDARPQDPSTNLEAAVYEPPTLFDDF